MRSSASQPSSTGGAGVDSPADHAPLGQPRLSFSDYLPLLWRLAIAAAVVITETVLRFGTSQDSPYVAETIPFQKYVYSIVVAWAASLTIFVVTSRIEQTRQASTQLAGVAPGPGWLVAHIVLIAPLMWPSALGLVVEPGVGAEILQHVLAVMALVSLLFGLVPPRVWSTLFRGAGKLVILALILALAAVLTMRGSQVLWSQATAVTFAMTRTLLQPFYPDLYAHPGTRILGTDSIEVFVDEACSGLEGVGLMLVFLAGWLWLLRREFRFPAALLLIPVAAATVFLLNSVRIAALFAIAAQGHVEVALAGFHSQAGWIFFNATVFLFAVVSRNIRWIQRSGSAAVQAHHGASQSGNQTAAYLLPLLVVLAAGMLTRAVSASIDHFYWLRLLAAGMILFAFRRHYRALDWRFGWQGIAAGILVFLIWLLTARWLIPPAGMPDVLAQLPALERGAWIGVRALVAVLAVPVVEELAFRGFLMRRLVSEEFATVRFGNVHARALILSSFLFGFSHGALWAPGIVAGLLFGMVAIRTQRFGDAVAAHAVANAMLAATVLGFGQWQLW